MKWYILRNENPSDSIHGMCYLKQSWCKFLIAGHHPHVSDEEPGARWEWGPHKECTLAKSDPNAVSSLPFTRRGSWLSWGHREHDESALWPRTLRPQTHHCRVENSAVNRNEESGVLGDRDYCCLLPHPPHLPPHQPSRGTSALQVQPRVSWRNVGLVRPEHKSFLGESRNLDVFW